MAFTTNNRENAVAPIGTHHTCNLFKFRVSLNGLISPTSAKDPANSAINDEISRMPAAVSVISMPSQIIS
jgi:hypothetical protein